MQRSRMLHGLLKGDTPPELQLLGRLYPPAAPPDMPKLLARNDALVSYSPDDIDVVGV